MDNEKIEKISDKVHEILDTCLMPKGNYGVTSDNLVDAIKYGNINSNRFFDEQKAEAVVREIYEQRMYRTPMTDDDFRRVSKVVAMIPLGEEDEGNDEMVVGTVLYSYITGKSWVNTFFSFLPKEVQKVDGVREDLEDTLDWIDLEINEVCDNPVFLSHDKAEEEIRGSFPFYYDEDGVLLSLSEVDITALTEILSHLPLAEESIGHVAAKLVDSYCDILSELRAKES